MHNKRVPERDLIAGFEIDRDDFTAQYLEALCIMSSPNENAPDPAVCDALGI